MFLCVFAWPREGHVEKCCVFVCFCSVEGGDVEKCLVFVRFLGKIDTFFFLFSLFLLRRRGEMSKSVVFVEKCRVFVCFLGRTGRNRPLGVADWRAQPTI